jgi:hypothetical protein
LLTGTPANAQAVNWHLNVDKSQYKPGQFPIKSLTIEVKELADGVRVTAWGEQINGLPIEVTHFVSWHGNVDNFSQADPSNTQARYYNAILAPFGTPACFNTLGEEVCVSIFGHQDNGDVHVNIKEVDYSTDKRPAKDCIPSKSRLAFDGDNTLVETTKGNGADGKFEQTFVYSRW